MLRTFALMALLWPLVAQADQPDATGEQLYEWCESPIGTAEYGFCVGFAAAGWQGMKFGAGAFATYSDPEATVGQTTAAVESLFGVCMPEPQSRRQVVSAFVNYLEANPVERHRPAVALLAFAVTEAYPCD